MNRFLPCSVLALIIFSGCSNEFTLATRPALSPEQVEGIVARAHQAFDGKRELLQRRAMIEKSASGKASVQKSRQHAEAKFNPEAAKSGPGQAVRERMRTRTAEKSTAPVEDGTATEVLIDEQVDG